MAESSNGPKASIREWTKQDVTDALVYLRRERPEIMAELDRLEIESGDLTDADSASIALGLLFKLHPECDLLEITDLFSAVRIERRSQLSLR